MSDEATTSTQDATYIEQQAHKRFAAGCFNKCWEYIDKADRTREDDLMMIHLAHASAYHWTQREDAKPENTGRGQWQLSRVYAIAGHPQAARFYAQCYLDICQAHGIADWDLAFAYEALARAAHVGGDKAARNAYLQQARAACAAVAGEEDRKLVESDLATIPTD